MCATNGLPETTRAARAAAYAIQSCAWMTSCGYVAARSAAILAYSSTSSKSECRYGESSRVTRAAAAPNTVVDADAYGASGDATRTRRNADARFDALTTRTP